MDTTSLTRDKVIPRPTLADDPAILRSGLFASLSITDLLEARDHYHVNLSHRKNVIGTAVGRYLIRKTDPYPGASTVDFKTLSSQHNNNPRTLENSEIRYYSWPCVLVFVDKWDAANIDDSDRVPKTLYLPDGRLVPVCILLTEKRVAVKAPGFPKVPKELSGGSPLFAEVQKQVRFATLGCLVSDGHTTYALTNRHVSGPPGEEVFAYDNGKQVRLGVSTEKQLSRKLFNQVYTKWPGSEAYSQLDVGLVKLDDIRRVFPWIQKIGRLGEVADFDVHNTSLKLIGCKVKGYGASSGLMHGVIGALYHRYKSTGGSDYIADFVFAVTSSENKGGSHPGDSGTVWVLDNEDGQPPQPVGVQWGGQTFQNAGGCQHSFALATCLSTICRLLDVEVITDWEDPVNEYWGAQGHFTIAMFAIERLKNKNLSDLMNANRDLMTFPISDLKQFKQIHGDFTWRLADAPDGPWKNKDTKRNTEGPNHYTDIDEKDSEFGDSTLGEMILSDPDKYLDPQVFKDYYDRHKSNYGTLPFRVGQVYKLMVQYANQKDTTRFFAACGILSHYIGDACQPLHGSSKGLGKIHSTYETKMVGQFGSKLLSKIPDYTSSQPSVKTGREAALESMKLLKKSQDLIPPQSLVDDGDALSMWNSSGEQTAQVMGLGADVLAGLWTSALGSNELDASSVDSNQVENLIASKDFLPSLTIDDFIQDSSIWA